MAIEALSGTIDSTWYPVLLEPRETVIPLEVRGIRRCMVTFRTSRFSAVTVLACIHIGFGFGFVVLQESRWVRHLDTAMAIVAEALLMA